MFGLTQLGVVHTAISLIAVGAAVVALFSYKEITLRTRSGRVYVAMTVASCVTGLFIFQHGGFGNPHVLAITTLIVLGIAVFAGHTSVFGSASRYVEPVAYSLSFYFHFIPGLAETTTRFPRGAPLFSHPEAPELLTIWGVLFGVFLIGAAFQVKLNRPPHQLLDE